MQANSEVTEPPARLNGDEVTNERKRLPDCPDEEPATKRARAENGSVVVGKDGDAPETDVKPLPKGTAPVKQE